MAQASKGYWAIAGEGTPGTAETTPDHFYPMIEADTDFENEFLDVFEMRGSRQAYKALDGRVAPAVTARGLVYPGGALGMILKGLTGAVTSEPDDDQGSPTYYTHTFTDAAALPYFTIERADARDGEGGLLCERVAGCKLESLSMEAAFGEEVSFDLSFQALKKPATASPVAASSITYPAMNPFVFSGAVVNIEGSPVSEFKSLSIEITNTLERQEALNGSQEAYKIFEGGVECTLSGTMVFDSLDMYNRLINNTEFELDLVFEGDPIAGTSPAVNHSLSINWPRVRVARYSVPFVAGEVIEADVDFRVIYDDVTAASFTAVLVNGEDGSDY